MPGADTGYRPARPGAGSRRSFCRRSGPARTAARQLDSRCPAAGGADGGIRVLGDGRRLRCRATGSAGCGPAAGSGASRSADPPPCGRGRRQVVVRAPLRLSFCQRSRAPVSAVADRLDEHRVHQLPVDDLLQRHRQQPAASAPVRAGTRSTAPSIWTASTASQSEQRSSAGRGRSARRSGRRRRAARAAAAGPGTAPGSAGPTRPNRPDGPAVEHRAAVLPHRLHGAVAPPVALPPQLLQRAPAPRSRRGRAPRRRPASRPGADRHREVGVLGERVVADPADLEQRGAAERADRAGDGGDAAAARRTPGGRC